MEVPVGRLEPLAVPLCLRRLTLAAALGAVAAGASAQPISKDDLPPSLRAWVPWVLDLGDHREIAGNAVTPVSSTERNTAAFDAALEVSGAFCAATHYWELETPSVHANEPIVGADGYVLPATQHDVVIWLTGASYDVVFDLSRAVVMALAGTADLANEIVGWPYHHDLDLTGFVDGTENPTVVEATQVAVIEDGKPGAGGSILLLQQWEHDAIGWEQLPVEAQEAIIGRRKADSAELDPAPQDSHVGRTDQEAFGKIFRRNIAYGTLGRHGTIFVGFCRDQRRLQAMLESMVGARSPAIDRLTTVTRPITGGYYVIPSAYALAARGADDRLAAPEEPY